MDAVRLHDNERLDIVDADRIQAFVDEYLGRVLGGLVGVNSGVLSTLSFDTSSLAAVSIGECLLYAGFSGGTEARLATGRVIRHDPTLPGQVSVVDLSAYVGLTPWIWARRVQVDSDMETRRKWDEGSGTEVAFSPYTVARSRVVFGVGGSTPDGNEGWFKFARVASWTGSVPAIVARHAFDLGYIADGDDWNHLSSHLGSASVMGLADVLTYIVLSLARMNDASGATKWTSPQAEGLAQLIARLDAAQASIVAARAEHNAQRVLADGAIVWNGSTYAFSGETATPAAGSTALPLTVTRIATGQVRLSWTAPGGVPVAVRTVLITPRANGDGNPADALPVWAHTSVVEVEDGWADIYIKGSDTIARDQSLNVVLVGSFDPA